MGFRFEMSLHRTHLTDLVPQVVRLLREEMEDMMKASLSLIVTRVKPKPSTKQHHRIFDQAPVASFRNPPGRDISANRRKPPRTTSQHRAVDIPTPTLLPRLRRLTARLHPPLHADKRRGMPCRLLHRVFRVPNLEGHAARAPKLLSHNRRSLQRNLDKRLHLIEDTPSLIRVL